MLRKNNYYYVVGGMVRCHPHQEVFLTPPLPRPLPMPLWEHWGTQAHLCGALVSWCCHSFTCLSAPKQHCSYRLGMKFCSSLCPQHLAQGLANNGSTTVQLLVGWMNKRMASFDLSCKKPRGQKLLTLCRWWAESSWWVRVKMDLDFFGPSPRRQFRRWLFSL